MPYGTPLWDLFGAYLFLQMWAVGVVRTIVRLATACDDSASTLLHTKVVLSSETEAPQQATKRGLV